MSRCSISRASSSYCCMTISLSASVRAAGSPGAATTGSVRGVYADGCDLFRKRMECAIAVAVARELGTE